MKKKKAEIPSGTAENRLKSLQIEYYSKSMLSKMSIHNLRRSLLKLSRILKITQLQINNKFIERCNS